MALFIKPFRVLIEDTLDDKQARTRFLWNPTYEFLRHVAEKSIDPFEIKQKSKFHPVRILWTAFWRALDKYGSISHRPMDRYIAVKQLAHYCSERGRNLEETAVTSKQAELLDLALAATEARDGSVLELGSYRGVTTEKLASNTRRTVYAVDPYLGYGGWESDMHAMQDRIRHLGNLQHIRLTSGRASKFLSGRKFSFIFIDAVHDFPNTWFDFHCWAPSVVPGGMLSLHDVDDFPGSNLASRWILLRSRFFDPWAYCPNIIVLRRK